MLRRLFVIVLALLLVLLAACASPTPTRVPPTTVPTTLPAGQSNLSVVKTYLLTKSSALKTQSATLAEASNRYYELAKDASFDYAALWQNQKTEVAKAIQDARTAWKAASPTYEQMEGIVAGVALLSKYDINLDAGASGSDPDSVTFDLTLPTGKVLTKPGNLFGMTEETLWGSRPEYSTGVPADFDGNGQADLGDVLPDANVLYASTALLNQMAGELEQAAQAWEPTDSDAFTALVANVPTVGDFFESWKTSRFVMGDQATHSDFVVISRLSDIVDNIASWQAIYGGVSPLVASSDATQDQQITKSLADLKSYVSKIYQQEQSGKHFTPEEADTLSVEAQNRATAIAGEIGQEAAKLNIKIAE